MQGSLFVCCWYFIYFSSSINYFINRKWSFNGTYTGFFKGYALFLFFSIFGVFLTVFLMWIIVDLILFNYLIARVIAAIIEGSITFLTNHHYTFKMPEIGVDKNFFKT
ncbi:GtrA family protein [Candidatus Pacearchaeota archaeon]|nr:GtrA family protein [Candidatus Pacearchaeota archaeon]